MKKNDILKVKIEDYTEEGFGVARADGYVLFIPNTIAGEEAEVLVVKVGTEQMVAADQVGAGIGDRVLLATGTVASRYCMDAPIDAAVVAILDPEGR